MISKNKKLFGISFLILLFILLLSNNWIYNQYQVYFTDYGYFDNWVRIYNLEIPKPKQFKAVFNSFGPLGEGEFYGIGSYDNDTLQEVKALKIWTKIKDRNEFMSVRNRINNFKGMVSQFYKQNPFLKNPIKLDNESLYYLRMKSDGSWLLAILQLKEAKLYAIEVAQ